MLNFTNQFFKSIHCWFPVLSLRRFQDRLPKLWDHSSADFALLVSSVSLLTMQPGDSTLSSEMNSLYINIKSSTAALEAIGINSLDLLQCHLLINLFEVLHGIYPAAFISIGTVARSGVVLGIYDGRLSDGPGQGEEEAEMIRRGISILDRSVKDSRLFSISLLRHDVIVCP
jgi:hypothetical protein